MNDLLDALQVVHRRVRLTADGPDTRLALGTSPRMYEYGGHTVRAWESVLRGSGMATDEQVAAAVAVSLQQFAVRPQEIGEGA